MTENLYITNYMCSYGNITRLPINDAYTLAKNSLNIQGLHLVDLGKVQACQGGPMKFDIVNIDSQNREFVVSFISENWGSSVIVSRGKVHNVKELPGFVAIEDEEVKGIVIYNICGSECEIVLLDSMLERYGIGSALIEKVLSIAIQNLCKRVWLITTNDNIEAIRFYQKRGFDLVAVHRYAISESRKIKPQIPVIGLHDIPILHEIEFEKTL